jgi:hypothetical protein
MISLKDYSIWLHEAKTPAASQRAEAAQTKSLKDQHSTLKEKHPDGVPIDFGDGEIHHVTSLNKVKGNPKADVVFHTTTKTKKYIALKNSADPARYRQLGGVSRTTEMKQNPVVQKFAKHLSRWTFNDDSPRQSYMLDRSNPDHNRILHQSVFGHAYGSDERHVNNIDSIHKGYTRIVPHPTIKGAYKLESDSAYHNGELPKHVQGELVRENSKKQHDIGLDNSRVYVALAGHNKTEDITNKVNKVK